ncbi:MAG: rhomboid family intramembrane serine protease [Gemmatimonadota bacterium]|nr:rhomboid family intramembrane serine protease [Gemmatimonadota bacterium]
MTSPTPFPLTPWVRRLLTANVAVFVLAAAIVTPSWVIRTFGFTPVGAAERPWTFLTYMFAHAGVLHLAVSGLMLLLFGPAVERRMGSGAFIRYYLLCGLGGPLAAFGLALVIPGVGPFTGASAAVFGVALAFALAWPEARVFVFPLPWSVPAGALVGLLAVAALLPFLLDTPDGVAHLAHLGGFVIGFLYLKGGEFLDRRGTLPEGVAPAEPVLVVHQSGAATADAPAERPLQPPRDDAALEMNRVLDKISRQGLASLTAAERRFLDEVSRQLRRE